MSVLVAVTNSAGFRVWEAFFAMLILMTVSAGRSVCVAGSGAILSVALDTLVWLQIGVVGIVFGVTPGAKAAGIAIALMVLVQPRGIVLLASGDEPNKDEIS